MAGCEPPDLVAQLYQQLKLPPESEAFPPDAKCIRLLDIFPPENSQDPSPLEGRLRITNLADNEPFTALSYVWGIDKENRSISIGETRVPVSANGHSALVHLRKKLGAFTIWIDAICIDQTNEKEKQRQIPLMGEIYSLAAPAYMWLGEGDEQSDRAMRLLGKTGILDCFLLDAVTLEPRPKPLAWRAYWRLTRPWRNGDKNPVPRIKPGWFNPYWLVQPAWLERKQASYEDINHLLSRSWIRRIWTLQEVLLTKHAIVVCGDHHVPWLRFACSLLALQEFIPRGKNKDLNLWNSMRPWSATAVVYIRNYRKQNSEKDDAAHMLPRFSFDAWPKFVRSIHIRCSIISWLTLMTTLVALMLAIGEGPLLLKRSTEFGFDNCLGPKVHCTQPHEVIIWFVLPLMILPISLILLISTTNIQYRLKRQKFSGTQLTDLILDREATNPKDKAFGVHSIMQRSLNQRLADPNYQLATEQIYKDLCLTVMSATKSLRVLHLAVTCPLSGHPTWIPDWNKKPNSFWMNTALARWNESGAFWKYGPSDPKALIVLARQLAIVEDVLTFDRQPADIDPIGLELQHVENLRKLIRVTKNGYTKDWSGHVRSFAEYMRVFWNLTMSASDSPLRKMRYDNFVLWIKVLARIRQTDANHIYKDWRQAPAWIFNLYVLRWRYLYPMDQDATNLLTATKFVTNVLAVSESLCTRIARNNCSLISWRTQSGDLRWTLSTSNARTGDKIVGVYGAGVFAVRGQDEEARLVGPVGFPAFARPEDYKLVQLRLI